MLETARLGEIAELRPPLDGDPEERLTPEAPTALPARAPLAGPPCAQAKVAFEPARAAPPDPLALPANECHCPSALAAGAAVLPPRFTDALFDEPLPLMAGLLKPCPTEAFDLAPGPLNLPNEGFPRNAAEGARPPPPNDRPLGALMRPPPPETCPPPPEKWPPPPPPPWKPPPPPPPWKPPPPPPPCPPPR